VPLCSPLYGVGTKAPRSPAGREPDGGKFVRRGTVRATLLVLLSPAGTLAAELDPAAVVFELPDQINWKESATAGNANAVLYGDPSEPSPYIVSVKWHAGHMSHPHFHLNDRFITVISGTWWVGAGTKFDPEATVPMPAGSFLTHFGKKIYYAGAKESDTVEIVGEGPAISTPAEQK
jgi:hypothetical protein